MKNLCINQSSEMIQDYSPLDTVGRNEHYATVQDNKPYNLYCRYTLSKLSGVALVMIGLTLITAIILFIANTHKSLLPSNNPLAQLCTCFLATIWFSIGVALVMLGCCSINKHSNNLEKERQLSIKPYKKLLSQINDAEFNNRELEFHINNLMEFITDDRLLLSENIASTSEADCANKFKEAIDSAIKSLAITVDHDNINGYNHAVMVMFNSINKLIECAEELDVFNLNSPEGTKYCFPVHLFIEIKELAALMSIFILFRNSDREYRPITKNNDNYECTLKSLISLKSLYGQCISEAPINAKAQKANEIEHGVNADIVQAISLNRNKALAILEIHKYVLTAAKAYLELIKHKNKFSNRLYCYQNNEDGFLEIEELRINAISITQEGREDFKKIQQLLIDTSRITLKSLLEQRM